MNTLQKATRIILEAQSQMLDHAQNLAAGLWVGREQDAGRVLVEISREVRKGVSLLLESDPEAPDTSWSTQTAPSERVGADEFARMLGWTLALFEDQRSRGLIPPPVGVYEKRPYWSQEQVKGMHDALVGAIRQAWGYPKEGGSHV